ncbi:MAG: hypothetical protein IAE80_02150 [Anaerolinea sp.]|nr:hypothetical protein [Anaerolinea sp.]
MDQTRLQELAARIKDILKEYEIDDEGFQLKIFVNQKYYDGIKGNFPKRNALDVVVGDRGEDWTIDIMYLRSLLENL